MNQSDQQQRIAEIFEKMNGSGAHACYCERSTDGGCKCAINGEYAAEATAAITTLINEAVEEALNERNRA